MHIAIIGKEDIIVGFRLIGIDIFPVNNIDQTKSILEDLVTKEYNLIFITEDIAVHLGERIKQIQEETNVCISILPVPGVKTYLARDMIRFSIRKALGTEVEV